MRNIVQMIVVLTGVALIAGLALGGLHSLTQQRIGDNVLRFKKLPAVLHVAEVVLGPLDEARKEELTNQLLKERLVVDGDSPGAQPRYVFLIRSEGEPHSLIIESQARGYGGSVVTMVGVNVVGQRLTGVGIATHSETPGVGSRIVETDYLSQFPGMKNDSNFKIKKDGGVVDAVSGATYSSRAVSESIAQALTLFNERGPALVEELTK